MTILIHISQFSHLIMSDSLWPHGFQHARLLCPSPTPRACSNSCPSSKWCHLTVSSSVVPFSSCLLSFPATRPFQMHQFFTSGGQSIGASASATILPMNIQGWFPLGLTYLINKWLSLNSTCRLWPSCFSRSHALGTALLREERSGSGERDLRSVPVPVAQPDNMLLGTAESLQILMAPRSTWHPVVLTTSLPAASQCLLQLFPRGLPDIWFISIPRSCWKKSISVSSGLCGEDI